MFSAPGGKYRIQVLWIKGKGGKKIDLAAKVTSGCKWDYMLSLWGYLLTHSEFNLTPNFGWERISLHLAGNNRQAMEHGTGHLLGPPEKETLVQVPIASSHHCCKFGQCCSGKSWKSTAEHMWA